MKKKFKREEMSLIDIRRLLESGMLLKHISRASNYSTSELALMCRCWGIKRKRGRRPKVAANGN
ncbi:MAG TPA: hypothetical protein VEF34_13845 [Syntrophobacteraceae bacterium]|nr:hypothetical protein [Syntrophobacteraceae bacterium]